MDGLPGDDRVRPQAGPKRLHPERVRDAITVDEGDGFSRRDSDAVVAAVSAGPPLQVEADEGVATAVLASDFARAVRAVGIDDEHLDGPFLRHEAVEEVSDVPLLVLHGHDDTDQHRRANGRVR